MKKIAICVILFLLIVPGIAWGQYSNVPRGSGGSGSGDVTKVGTPTEHQQAVWTGRHD